MIRPNSDPLMSLAHAYNEQTKLIPQMPYGPLVQVTALELTNDPAVGFTVEDIPRVPDMLNADHLTVIREATAQEHRNRRFYIPTDDEQRRAFGFVTTSIVTAAAELAKGADGVRLPDIHKPSSGDTAIAAGVEYLRDPANAQLFLSIGRVGVQVQEAAKAAGVTAQYQANLTRTARRWGSPTPGTAEFFAKIEAMSLHRADISEHLGRQLGRRLVTIREQAIAGTLEPELSSIGELSVHEMQTVAHNLARWRPNDDWFRPPQQ